MSAVVGFLHLNGPGLDLSEKHVTLPRVASFGLRVVGSLSPPISCAGSASVPLSQTLPCAMIASQPRLLQLHDETYACRLRLPPSRAAVAVSQSPLRRPHGAGSEPQRQTLMLSPCCPFVPDQSAGMHHLQPVSTFCRPWQTAYSAWRGSQ